MTADCQPKIMKIEKNHKRTKKIGYAEKDPKTTGPSENLREALEETDAENTVAEPC